LRLQDFFETCPNVNRFLFVSRAVTRSGIANEFWKWRRRHLPALAQTRAWTTSPEKPASDRERYTVTSLRARNFWRRFIGLRWRSWPERKRSSRKNCPRGKPWGRGCCCLLSTSPPSNSSLLHSTRCWVIQRRYSRLPTPGSTKRFAHW